MEVDSVDPGDGVAASSTMQVEETEKKKAEEKEKEGEDAMKDDAAISEVSAESEEEEEDEEEVKKLKGRLGYESEAQWKLRKKFIDSAKNEVTLPRLKVLSAMFFNILILGNQYGEVFEKEVRKFAPTLPEGQNYPGDVRRMEQGKLIPS
uniref:XRN2-binding (XTBD) domain-containing protein n=1 Tax=Chromera velia CCMP2878 TaxID=1169474 RepID=A0A0G4FPZ7_9ALVE|mmetsp:Transcript_17283/g.35092  ORF Transcript_17283/g.35092 Transcript_17283/m.35092 type:complete len:150 (-) Transcript_17283:149-598(-)|eukprot:Cvel_18180.t1-p1 / transcript=Cvel_18180.t1 / gene=Cvel_18180 / organism=Chromera_velia_CCMP2878 / gene_product=hypothetical protein / transcript_product=hypothetical protein / location=Cvel_scaffold1491:25186-25632(+) / protein_length=149 / sequence_SO=supercontig / SO=protein_coding / is_pseudo=false